MQFFFIYDKKKKERKKKRWEKSCIILLPYTRVIILYKSAEATISWRAKTQFGPSGKDLLVLHDTEVILHRLKMSKPINKTVWEILDCDFRLQVTHSSTHVFTAVTLKFVLSLTGGVQRFG